MHLGKTKVMLNQYTSSAPIIVDGIKDHQRSGKLHLPCKGGYKEWGSPPQDKEKDSTGMGSFWKGEHHEKPQSKYDNQRKVFN